MREALALVGRLVEVPSELALDRVLRAPKISATLAAAFLLVLTIPVLHMHTADTGTDALPRNLAVVKVYDKMQAAFPGGEIPAVVVFKAKDVTSPQITAAVQQLVRDAVATGKVKQPADVTVSPDHHVLQVSLPIIGTGTVAEWLRSLANRRGRTWVCGPSGDLPSGAGIDW